VTAAVLALVATALAHLLVATTPRPRSFFSWTAGVRPSSRREAQGA
jgi:hypothetical protein